jgi:hypothetical protein
MGAPAVYRPQPTVFQPTMTNLAAQSRRTAAPPVYRPQASLSSGALAGALTGAGRRAGILQPKILKLRAHEFSTKQLSSPESLMSEKVIRGIQSARTVMMGAESLAQKKQRGAIIEDTTGTLSDLGTNEKLYIIGHGLEEESNQDLMFRITKIDKYGGYTPAELAELLLEMGIPENYGEQIHLTGCYPAAGEGASYLSRFQMELRKLGISSAVRGGLGSTIIDDQGKIWVGKHVEVGQEYLDKFAAEMDYEKLLGELSRLIRGEIPSESKPPELLDKEKELKQYEGLSEITFEQLIRNTQLQEEVGKQRIKIGKSLASSVREKIGGLGENIRERFYVPGKSRKVTLPGGPIKPGEIENERVARLRAKQRVAPGSPAPVLYEPIVQDIEVPPPPQMYLPALQSLATEAAEDAYSGHTFQRMRTRIHNLVEQNGARIAFNKMMVRAFALLGAQERQRIRSYLFLHFNFDLNSHPVNIYEALSHYFA